MTFRQRAVAIYEHTKVYRIPFARETILPIKTLAMISYECNKRTIVLQLQFIHRVFTWWNSAMFQTHMIYHWIQTGTHYFSSSNARTHTTEAYEIIYSGWIRHMGFIMPCTWMKIDLQLVFSQQLIDNILFECLSSTFGSCCSILLRQSW